MRDTNALSALELLAAAWLYAPLRVGQPAATQLKTTPQNLRRDYTIA